MKNWLLAFIFLVIASPAFAQSIVGQPITNIQSAAAESNHVLKASGGFLYSISVTTGGSAGYVLMFNATSAPADGAVTPVRCYVVAANSTVSFEFSRALPFGTGITAVFSTTGCFTKTASATAFISAQVI